MLLIGLLCASAVQGADPIVKQGRVWYYDLVTFDEETQTQKREFSSAWTFGDAIEQNGHTYYNFRETNGDDYQHMYLRQEGDKVYLLLNKSGYSEEFLAETGGEILLYDFSLSQGESIDSYYVHAWGGVFTDTPDRMTVISTETMVVNGVERRGQCLDLYFREYDGTLTPRWKSNQVVEGIGCQTGFLTRPCDVDVFTHYEPGGLELSKVCDGDVEIFNHTDFDRYFTGVEEVSDDGVKDGKMYDIMGREVKNPQPGSVYIQDGRKFVAR